MNVPETGSVTLTPGSIIDTGGAEERVAKGKLTLYTLMATIELFFCRIGKFNPCTYATLILKNLHHWFVFYSDFRTYQVFSGPCISQCIVLNWKALMFISPRFS